MSYLRYLLLFLYFLFFAPSATEIYTLSLHDALPILPIEEPAATVTSRTLDTAAMLGRASPRKPMDWMVDRKSTRLNSSHTVISYAVFCLKKKKNTKLSNQLLVF